MHLIILHLLYYIQTFICTINNNNNDNNHYNHNHNHNDNDNDNENDSENDNDLLHIFWFTLALYLLTKLFENLKIVPFKNSNIVSFDFSRT